MLKKHIIFFLLVALALPAVAQRTATSNGYPYGQVPFTQVKISPNSFWGQRIKAARDVTIPLAFEKCETEGRYENFKKATHPSDDNKCTAFPFDDTDVYKTIEGASYVLQTFPDKRLEQYIDSVLNIVAAAQEPDGYLYTPRTMNPQHPHPWTGIGRWSQVEVLSHELYNLGHMVDAAVAHYQATGSTKFLNIAKRYADCVIREVGPREGQHHVVPGHQIAEMALARLYVLTGEKKYLDEAKYFLDWRGKTSIHDLYTQSDKPILEQKEAWGHAVRAGYMYAGMADVAALTGDSAYINAIDVIWQNIVERKYYLTGGVGARHAGEAFGADYELPNLTAYNETCAAIAQVYFNHRMFLLHGDAKYIDCLERTLYNGVISGMSVDGGRFFYPNPLACDGQYRFNSDNTIERQPWFGCACCPSNLCRFIPSLPGYLYAVKGDAIYVNLYAESTADISIGGKTVTLEQQTQYPWNGDIALRIGKTGTKSFKLLLRIPEWAQGQPVPSALYRYTDGTAAAWQVSVNGQTVTAQIEKGYITIDRKWKKGDCVRIHFDMPVHTVEACEQVEADRGKVAVERGPLVYCAESVDNSYPIFRFVMPQKPVFQLKDCPDIANGITAITTTGQVLTTGNDGQVELSSQPLTLIPYYAWNHRGRGQMTVWHSHSLNDMLPR